MVILCEIFYKGNNRIISEKTRTKTKIVMIKSKKTTTNYDYLCKKTFAI